MNNLNKVKARTSLLRVLEHIVYPSNNNKEWQKQAPSEHFYLFFCLSLFMGVDIETLLGNCLNLSNPLDNQQNQRKVDNSKKDSTIWHSSSACRGLGALRLLRSDQPDQPINRSADQPIERAKNVACQIFKYKYNNNRNNNSIGIGIGKNNGNINNIKDNKAALSNVLSSIGLRSLTNFSCQSFVQSQ